ncbi:MAG: ATP-dependent DNA ligase, partial [Verrucomicrobia bacterium]|nr:ATP-dependent DNA ligase [Verrucomicrobiota bacterium]
MTFVSAAEPYSPVGIQLCLPQRSRQVSEIYPPVQPMEAVSVDEIPIGDHWQYEPKWDGFRCLLFRENSTVYLQSKAGQPLGRYFPEIVASSSSLPSTSFVLDGELAIPMGDKLSFDHLLQRIHPAVSRVNKLSIETPAIYIVFDLLSSKKLGPVADRPLAERRSLLEQFAKECLTTEQFKISPATTEMRFVREWLEEVGDVLDGIVAKRLDLPYTFGARSMEKVKNYRSADCVVGGFRYGAKTKFVGSLLLGLYNDEGLLDHIGFCSGIKATDRVALTKKLESLVQSPGFTGKAPGGPSRWSTERSDEWVPLRTELVVEVS